jgi:hypothetical protein
VLRDHAHADSTKLHHVEKSKAIMYDVCDEFKDEMRTELLFDGCLKLEGDM